jgi:hypothetical protein
MTRSIVLTLHGELVPAAHMNPAGPIWVLAALSLSVALLCARRWVRPLAFVQGFAFALVLGLHWTAVLLAR